MLTKNSTLADLFALHNYFTVRMYQSAKDIKNGQTEAEREKARKLNEIYNNKADAVAAIIDRKLGIN